MEAQLAAVRDLTEFLNAKAIKHFVIGGIANAIWGQPRATQDADFKVIVGNREIDEIVALVAERFEFRVSDPSLFARRTYVLPIYASNKVPVDVGLGFLPYEDQAVDRGILVRYQDVDFLVCTAEDLIIQKAVSERDKDWSDIEGVLIRQGAGLDQIYISRWLAEFAAALERPELVLRYRELCRQTSLK